MSIKYFYILPCPKQEMFAIGITKKFVSTTSEQSARMDWYIDSKDYDPDFEQSWLFYGEGQAVKDIETNFKHQFRSERRDFSNLPKPAGYTEQFNLGCFANAMDWLRSQEALKMMSYSIAQRKKDVFRGQLQPVYNHVNRIYSMLQAPQILWVAPNYPHSVEKVEADPQMVDVGVEIIQSLKFLCGLYPFFGHAISQGDDFYLSLKITLDDAKRFINLPQGTPLDQVWYKTTYDHIVAMRRSEEDYWLLKIDKPVYIEHNNRVRIMSKMLDNAPEEQINDEDSINALFKDFITVGELQERGVYPQRSLGKLYQKLPSVTVIEH